MQAIQGCQCHHVPGCSRMFCICDNPCLDSSMHLVESQFPQSALAYTDNATLDQYILKLPTCGSPASPAMHVKLSANCLHSFITLASALSGSAGPGVVGSVRKPSEPRRLSKCCLILRGTHDSSTHYKTRQLCRDGRSEGGFRAR
jgi:hypothetical protein